MKKALITGITGQDGSLLAERLVSKGYIVVGTGNPKNQRATATNLRGIKDSIRVHYIDISDITAMTDLLREEVPDEIYNLAAQSNSLDAKRDPLETSLRNGFSVAALLKATRNYCPDAHFFQASSSEIFGQTPVDSPQNEATTCKPDNPYSIAKYFAQQTICYYREQEGLFACSGILYNHESIRRKAGFLTRKIIKGVAAVKMGQDESLILGNLDAVRDWGSAEDYVQAMHLMLQADTAKDYIIATGIGHTVREFVEIAFRAADMTIVWKNTGFDEVGIEQKTGKVLIRVSAEFYREQENQRVIGDPSKIKCELDWKVKTPFEELIRDMVKEELCNGIL